MNTDQLVGPLEVYHNPNFNDVYDSGGKFPRIENCQHVATVATCDIDEAYRLTNHIEQSWTENAGLSVHNGIRHRSTSMGDLVVDSRGETLVCAASGWHSPEEYAPHMVEVEKWFTDWNNKQRASGPP